jgi:hypothetical protein
MRTVAYAAFDRNVGMLLARRSYSIRGTMCKHCIDQKFWEFTWKNLTMGWWGTILLIITPVYFVMNGYRYASARYKLRDALD